MRTFVIATVAAAALVVTGASQPATTAVTKNVNITATAFTPASVTIKTGDSIKWTNKDTKTHQVVSNSGAFASAIISPNHTYKHTFNTSGTYRYHDALHPALTGKIVVTGPPPAVSIEAGTPILVYGQATHIHGQISNGQAGETVTVYSQPYGEPSATLIATVLTGTGGVWDTVVTGAADDLPGPLEEHAQLDRAGGRPPEDRVHALASWVRRGQGHHEPLDEGPQGLHPAPHALW